MKLSDEDAALFYKLMWPLQLFVNQKLGVLPGVDALGKYVKLPQEDKMRVRNALWEHVELIDDFVTANPTGMSADELAVVQGWKGRVAGDFTIERFLKRGAIFISGKEPPHVYLVLALRDSFEEILPPFGPPLYVKAVLLPFRGRIVYDGLLTHYAITLGPGIRASLRDIYLRAKQRGEIIETMEPRERAVRGAVYNESARHEGDVPVVSPPAQPRPAGSAAGHSRAVPDTGPELDRILAVAEKLKAPGQPVQGAALAVLKASARLAQAAAQNPDDLGALWGLAQGVQRALKRLQTTLERAE
jgi:hypothetical protein